MNLPINEQLLLRANKAVRLTAAEKAAHKQALRAEMDAHPLPSGAMLEHAVTTPVLNVTRRRTFTRTILTRVPAGLLVAALLGGGVTFAAANTLPGDVLYPVKIHVNENVESVFVVGDSAKAKLEANFALRRLSETEKLESEARLDTQAKADLKQNFDEHTARIEMSLQAIKKNKDRQTDADEISAQFNTSLHGHKNALGLLGVEVGDDSDDASGSTESTTSVNTSNSEQSGEGGEKHLRQNQVLLNAVFRSNDNEGHGSQHTSSDAATTSLGSDEHPGRTESGETSENGDHSSKTGEAQETTTAVTASSAASTSIVVPVEVHIDTGAKARSGHEKESEEPEIETESD